MGYVSSQEGTSSMSDSTFCLACGPARDIPNHPNDGGSSTLVFVKMRVFNVHAEIDTSIPHNKQDPHTHVLQHFLNYLVITLIIEKLPKRFS